MTVFKHTRVCNSGISYHINGTCFVYMTADVDVRLEFMNRLFNTLASYMSSAFNGICLSVIWRCMSK